MTQRLLFTEKEVEELTGIPQTTLRTRRVRGGGPPFIKIGSRVYYSYDDIVAYINDRRRTSTADIASRAAEG